MVQRLLIYFQEFQTKTKDSFGIAHFSFRRTLRIFKNLPQGEEIIFWDGLKSDNQKFVVEFLVCQQNKVETIKTLCLLQPLSIPSQC